MSHFYVRNLILPNGLLLALSSLTFFIPGEAGERIGFGVTVTLALCVNLIIVIDFIPETSKTIPNLCSYFLTSIFLSGFSLLLATLSLNIQGWKSKKLSNSGILKIQGGKVTPDMPSEIPDVCTGLTTSEKKFHQKLLQLRQMLKFFGKRLINTLTSAKMDKVVGFLYILGTTTYTLLFINSGK